MAQILLTGADGLLGRQLVGPLSEAHRVFAADLRPFAPEAPSGETNPVRITFDLRDYGAVYEAFARHRIDCVVHAAAISHPGPSFAQPIAAVQINFDATVTLLEAARLFGVRRFVFISSIGVYGDYTTPLVDERHAMAGNSPYGVTKIAAELMGRMYAKEFGLDFTALRYSHIYGPDRRLACPVKMLVEAAVAGRPVRLPAGADMPLNLIYQADAAGPVLRCVEGPAESREYNIGDGARHRLQDVADLLKSEFPDWQVALGPGPLPRALTGLPDGEGKPATIDIARARAELGFAPRHDLPRALRDYVRQVTVRSP